MDSQNTAVLTGVGREGQVGEAVARAFAKAGIAVALLDRSEERAAARAAALSAEGHSAEGYGCDLADASSLAATGQRIRSRFGDGVSCLVHMAGGFAASGPVSESDIEVWREQLRINLETAYLTCREFLPVIRARKGAIVLFASQAALPGATPAGLSAYAAAKAGVIALMRAMAAEERKNGVRANAIAPNAIRTASNVASMGDKGSYVALEDVANAAVFLCSDDARAITGQIIALG